MTLVLGRLVLAAGLSSCGQAAAGGTPQAGDAGATGDASSGSDAPSSSFGLPCAVDGVLAGHCRQCHSSPPQFGAPMPLVTYADLRAPAHSDPTKQVYALVGERIHDDARPMPQPPNPRLSATDTATLDAWIAVGAPEGATCDAAAPGPDSGPPPLSCTPDTHVAPGSAWTMPADADETYVCYGFDATVATKRHIIALAPRVDNHAILHHISLLQADSSVSPVPAVCPLGGSITWRAVFGWAPGGSSIELPPEAGFAEDPTTHYVVQVHYVNPTHTAGQLDQSGFDLCTTDQLRPNDADVMAFGTVAISIPPHATLDTTCDVPVPAWGATTHLFAAFPHMHRLGKSIATVARSGGTGPAVDLGSQPAWDYGGQGWITIDDLLQPGDVVETHCVWNNTTDSVVGFGELSTNEMCYSFTMYYPKIVDPRWNWALPAIYSQCR